jgi:hypothetical protein
MNEVVKLIENSNLARITELMKAKQRMGKTNGRWRGGKSVSYYRRRAGKKPNDGKVVHHVNKGKKGGKGYGPKAKYRLVTPAKHNKLHPEKGRKNKKK